MSNARYIYNMQINMCVLKAGEKKNWLSDKIRHSRGQIIICVYVFLLVNGWLLCETGLNLRNQRWSYLGNATHELCMSWAELTNKWPHDNSSTNGEKQYKVLRSKKERWENWEYNRVKRILFISKKWNFKNEFNLKGRVNGFSTFQSVYKSLPAKTKTY